MRFIVAGAALCTSLALIALPAAAQVERFVGGGFISDAQNCPGFGGIQQATASFNPVGSLDPDIGRDSSLSIFFPEFAVNYRFPEDFPTGQFVDATEYGAVSDIQFIFLPEPPPRMRVRFADVTTVFSEENEIHVILDFENWLGNPGCSVNGELWLYRAQ